MRAQILRAKLSHFCARSVSQLFAVITVLLIIGRSDKIVLVDFLSCSINDAGRMNMKVFPLAHRGPNFRTNEEDISEYFSKFGALADVYIPRPHRGFAFVTFEKGDDAETVLKVRVADDLLFIVIFKHKENPLSKYSESTPFSLYATFPLQQKHFMKDSPLNVTIPDPPAKKQKFGAEGEGYGETGRNAAPPKSFGGYRSESSSYYSSPYVCTVVSRSHCPKVAYTLYK